MYTPGSPGYGSDADRVAVVEDGGVNVVASASVLEHLEHRYQRVVAGSHTVARTVLVQDERLPAADPALQHGDCTVSGKTAGSRVT